PGPGWPPPYGSTPRAPSVPWARPRSRQEVLRDWKWAAGETGFRLNPHCRQICKAGLFVPVAISGLCSASSAAVAAKVVWPYPALNGLTYGLAAVCAASGILRAAQFPLVGLGNLGLSHWSGEICDAYCSPAPPTVTP